MRIHADAEPAAETVAEACDGGSLAAWNRADLVALHVADHADEP